MAARSKGNTYRENSARGRNVFGNIYDSGDDSRTNSKNNSRNNSSKSIANILNSVEASSATPPRSSPVPLVGTSKRLNKLVGRKVIITNFQWNCLRLVKYPQQATAGYSVPKCTANPTSADRYRIEHLVSSLDPETAHYILVDTAIRYPPVARFVEAEVEVRARVQPIRRLKPTYSNKDEDYEDSSDSETEEDYSSEESKTDESYGTRDSETDEDYESEDSGSETSSYYEEDEHDEQVHTTRRLLKSWCRRKFSMVISSGWRFADCLTEMVLDKL